MENQIVLSSNMNNELKACPFDRILEYAAQLDLHPTPPFEFPKEKMEENIKIKTFKLNETTDFLENLYLMNENICKLSEESLSIRESLEMSLLNEKSSISISPQSQVVFKEVLSYILNSNAMLESTLSNIESSQNWRFKSNFDEFIKTMHGTLATAGQVNAYITQQFPLTR